MRTWPGRTPWAQAAATGRALTRAAGDSTVWEQEPLESLAHSGQLSAYPHDGFWQPMDTLRDRKLLEDLWASGKAPWKVW